MIKAILFDVGGVFRDTSKAMHLGLKSAFESHGLSFDLTPEEVWHLRGIHVINPRRNFINFALSFEGDVERIFSMSYAEAVSLCSPFATKQHPLADIIAEESERHFYLAKEVEDLFREERFMILSSLKQRFKIGVVTNSKVESLERDIPDILPLMDVVVGKDHVSQKKPHPEPLLKAAALLKLEPSEVAYIADSVHDAMAAKAAGMRFVGVETGMSLPHWLKEQDVEVARNFISATKIISTSL